MGVTFGSLFAGIGGFDLGFERAGMECRWQVEIDDYANRVLAKHWPSVRRWPDVRTWPQPDTERVDVICGGFPCQDISVAGRKVGIEGERSGLWCEFARIVRVLRPRFVVVENTPALLDRGIGRVLGDLAEGGFNVEWDCLPAAAFGAPHIRDRLFIVAANVPDSSHRCSRQLRWSERKDEGQEEWNLYRQGHQPRIPRVVDGVSDRLDRIRCCGNSIVPQAAEWVGRRIVEAVNGTPVWQWKEVQ